VPKGIDCSSIVKQFVRGWFVMKPWGFFLVITWIAIRRVVRGYSESGWLAVGCSCQGLGVYNIRVFHKAWV